MGFKSTFTHTHTHTYTYVYVCVCVYIHTYDVTFVPHQFLEERRAVALQHVEQ